MTVSPDVMPDPFNLNFCGHLQQVAEYDVIHTSPPLHTPPQSLHVLWEFFLTYKYKYKYKDN